jgi:hypothetical protein
MVGESLRNINTKNEFIEASKELKSRIADSRLQLGGVTRQVELLKNSSKISIIRNISIEIDKLSLNEKVEVISIPLIKNSINSILREYALIKADVNQLSSARSSFDLSNEEKEDSRNLKRSSDNFQIDVNQANNDLNDFSSTVEDKIRDGEYLEFKIDMSEMDGGMTQIEPPDLTLYAGTPDTVIDSVVDDLEGIVVLC